MIFENPSIIRIIYRFRFEFVDKSELPSLFVNISCECSFKNYLEKKKKVNLKPTPRVTYRLQSRTIIEFIVAMRNNRYQTL